MVWVIPGSIAALQGLSEAHTVGIRLCVGGERSPVALITAITELGAPGVGFTENLRGSNGLGKAHRSNLLFWYAAHLVCGCC